MLSLQDGATVNAAAFVFFNQIKNENDLPIEFDNHRFLLKPYSDMSKRQVARKSTQVGWSTLAIVRAIHLCNYTKANVIYTLPSKSVVKDFVTPKVDPLIEANPVIKKMIGQTDSTALKAVGKRFIYFRGSWEQSSAITISGDVLINDEYDRSNQLVLETYKTRLDASALNNPDLGFEWHFSNPSTPGAGVDGLWTDSNQQHWYIKCSRCNKEQFLEWPDNIDMKNEVYICKHCKLPLSPMDRKNGHWYAHHRSDISGYWINQLMVPWIPASKIILNSKKDQQIFHNFTLGLPYVSAEDKISEDSIRRAIILEENPRTDVAIGVDIGITKHYVIGNKYGIFRVGTCTSWEEIEDLRNRYSAYMVIDAMPMPDPVMRLVQKYSGKIFMSYFSKNKKQLEVIEWGKGDKRGVVYSDRTKIIDAVVADIRTQDIVFNIPPNGLEEYISHARNMYRVTQERLSPEGGKTGEVTQDWLTIGSRPDHFIFATVYWKLAMEQTLSHGAIIRPPRPNRKDLLPPIHVDEYGETSGINIDEAIDAAIAESKYKHKR
jgi:DNA-directed RNA polymerase subunit RPC12/RpoP